MLLLPRFSHTYRGVSGNGNGNGTHRIKGNDKDGPSSPIDVKIPRIHSARLYSVLSLGASWDIYELTNHVYACCLLLEL